MRRCGRVLIIVTAVTIIDSIAAAGGLRHSLKFPPAASAELDLEAVPLADGEFSGNRLNFSDLAEAEIHLHDLA
jgi:hypothetical protein